MKRIIFLSIILLLLIIIIRLVTSIYTLWHKQDVLTNAQQQLQQEKQENTMLHKELTKVNSPQFLDQQARDKLLLVKPGETDVLISPNLLKASSITVKKEETPYWQQWISLFF